MERKWEAKLKQIEERAACYGRKPLSSVYRPRLSKPEEPPSIWKLFHRQTEAFNFVKSCKEDVHVFALEYKVGDGQRIYLVTTYTQLWFYYKSRMFVRHFKNYIGLTVQPKMFSTWILAPRKNLAAI
uniref:DNA-directed primase/polymerase protein n=1 Tax=Felis catus TaxID=9685 RepID=A0ABI7X023_FELCA